MDLLNVGMQIEGLAKRIDFVSKKQEE